MAAVGLFGQASQTERGHGQRARYGISDFWEVGQLLSMTMGMDGSNKG